MSHTMTISLSFNHDSFEQSSSILELANAFAAKHDATVRYDIYSSSSQPQAEPDFIKEVVVEVPKQVVTVDTIRSIVNPLVQPPVSQGPAVSKIMADMGYERLKDVPDFEYDILLEKLEALVNSLSPEYQELVRND